MDLAFASGSDIGHYALIRKLRDSVSHIGERGTKCLDWRSHEDRGLFFCQAACTRCALPSEVFCSSCTVSVKSTLRSSECPDLRPR